MPGRGAGLCVLGALDAGRAVLDHCPLPAVLRVPRAGPAAGIRPLPPVQLPGPCLQRDRSAAGQPAWHPGPPRRWRRRRRRRQRLRDGLLALALPLSVGAGRFLWVPSSRSSLERLEGARRRLLGVVLEDNKEVLGFVLGLLSALIALTARISALSRAAANWVPLHVFPKPRTGPRMVATSHSLDLMIRLVQQSGHSVARLPGDAQTGPAGPVPPQPPACPPLLARCPGVSPSSSSDATSINSELEEAACPPCCPQGAVLPGHPSHPAAAPPAPFSSQWDFEDMTVQWSRPSPAAQPCSVLSPGTFRQPAAPPRHPKHPSPQPSKQ
ncbi:transmembrane protein 44 isoform X4 [Chroicocephalus ridibundus]|uniref:transmembrane protein 44 isoform X4 n=1 Tax=Chroicocephalus ridibundus TaxID=1192867 RepID=UPI002FDE9B9B